MKNLSPVASASLGAGAVAAVILGLTLIPAPGTRYVIDSSSDESYEASSVQLETYGRYGNFEKWMVFVEKEDGSFETVEYKAEIVDVRTSDLDVTTVTVTTEYGHSVSKNIWGMEFDGSSESRDFVTIELKAGETP